MISRSFASAVLAAGLVAGSNAGATPFDDELAAIKARLAALEQQVAEQNHLIQEKDRQIEALTSNPSIHEHMGGKHWIDRVQISGLIEVEAGYNAPDSGNSSSDIVVSTVELGVAAQISEWVAGEITLLYEDPDTDLEIDVATITIADPDAPWFLNLGQQYIPFGTYETNMVSDPLTLEIGEVREVAVLAGFASEGFLGGVYLFNGDLAEGGDDDIDAYGAFAGYSREDENSAFGMHVSYISDIGDSNGLQDVVQENLNIAAVDYDAQVPGVAVDVRFTTGPFTVIAGYVTATDAFKPSELGFGTGGAQPSAFNIEAGYGFTAAGKEATVAVGFQQTCESAALGLPEQRVLAALTVALMERARLAFEWAHDDDYSAADGGTGANGGDTATMQLAVEF